MVSIIFGHYSEDEQRDAIAYQSLMSAYKQIEPGMELIIVFNGHYPYKDEFLKYADKFDEREADPLPGRTINKGIELAEGEIIFYMSNDTLLYDGAVKECVRLIREYPQFLVTPIHPPRYKEKLNVPFGEYVTNKRSGDLAVCMTRAQIEDIGEHDEVALLTDEINYINRRIAKGYTVLLTKEPMGKDLAPNIHSFVSQMPGWRGYKREEPIYSKEELIKLSYE